MAAKTQANGPGVTSLGWYDKKYDEIVLVEAFYGMRVRGDMCGWHKIPHWRARRATLRRISSNPGRISKLFFFIRGSTCPLRANLNRNPFNKDAG
jgi:hypothetical protein